MNVFGKIIFLLNMTQLFVTYSFKLIAKVKFVNFSKENKHQHRNQILTNFVTKLTYQRNI